MFIAVPLVLRRAPRHTEDVMIRMVRLLILVASLVPLLDSTPSWGQPPNPTASDAFDNTAGGDYALSQQGTGVGAGHDNTAFGRSALMGNTAGNSNAAIGS